MEQKKIERLNHLARKAKTAELNEDEKQEQKMLREQYIAMVRHNVKQALDNTYIKRPDGTMEKLKRKNERSGGN